MKTAIELIAEKHAKNMMRFPADIEAPYHQNGELASAAVFTLTNDPQHYPPNWSKWYLENRVAEGNEIENLVNAGALIAAEIERLQRLNLPEAE